MTSQTQEAVAGAPAVLPRRFGLLQATALNMSTMIGVGPLSSTVLIVDDEESGRQTIESVLEGEGYNIELAESGFQAIEKARQLLPDVILLDVMMPGMTGSKSASASVPALSWQRSPSSSSPLLMTANQCCAG